MTTVDSVLGCIIGGAIGDAAGSAYEGNTPRPENQPWAITDDTQLTLATCEALTVRGVDPEAIAEAMLRWFRERRLRGVGASTLKALRDLDAGCHWALAGRSGERAAGNGAAMRIAPLAFCVDPHTVQGRQSIRDVCRITHHHDEAYAGALAVVMAIRSVSLSDIASTLPDSVVRDRLLALDRNASFSEAARKNGVTGFVADTVPVALLLARSGLGFNSMLEQILRVGGDTDTIASIAGQVAGSALGLSGLPEDLVERLPEREMILEVARRFAGQLPGG